MADVHLDLTADEIRELRADRATRARDLASRAARVQEADRRASRAEPAPVAVAQPTPSKAAPSASKPPKRPPPKTKAPPAAPPVQVAGRLGEVVRFALAQAGKPYVFGTAGPRTYDCSGLLVAAWARIGVRLPHQSGAIARLGRAVPRAQWIPGTVLVYSGHVAIFVGNGRMIHAANPRKGVLVAAVYGSPQGRLIG